MIMRTFLVLEIVEANLDRYYIVQGDDSMDGEVAILYVATFQGYKLPDDLWEISQHFFALEVTDALPWPKLKPRIRKLGTSKEFYVLKS